MTLGSEAESKPPSPGNNGNSGRLLFNEAFLLALSSAVAYAVAMEYERGAAAHFGYPDWLITVNFQQVLGIWTALALVAAVGALVGMVISVLLPGRPFFALVRATWPVVLPLGAGAYLWQREDHPVLRAIILSVFTLAAAPPAFFILRDAFSKARGATWVERLERHAAKRTSDITAAAKRGQPAVIDVVEKTVPSIGVAMVLLLFLVLGFASLMGFAQFLGSRSAENQTEYLTSVDDSTRVVLRRFDDAFVVGYISPLRAGHISQYEVLSSEAFGQGRWHIRLVGPLTGRHPHELEPARSDTTMGTDTSKTATGAGVRPPGRTLQQPSTPPD